MDGACFLKMQKSGDSVMMDTGDVVEDRFSWNGYILFWNASDNIESQH